MANELGINKSLDELEDDYYAVLEGELQMSEEKFMWIESILMEKGRL